MMRTFTAVVLFTVMAGAAFGQSTPQPAFVIADVHASTTCTNPDTFVSGGLPRSGRHDLRTATMPDLIRIVWGTDAARVPGGPAWQTVSSSFCIRTPDHYRPLR